MSAVVRRMAGVIAAAILSLTWTSPTFAADEITIDHVGTDRGEVSLLVSTDGLPREPLSTIPMSLSNSTVVRWTPSANWSMPATSIVRP